MGKNSHLVNALMVELSEQIGLDMGGAQHLDLGTSGTLETQLRAIMDNVDELNQESIKFNKHQNMQLKQYQEKTRWIQKRQMENQARIARGEEAPRRGPVQVVQDDAGPLPSQPSYSIRHHQQHGQRGLRVLFAVAGQALHHGTPAGCKTVSGLSATLKI